jgi:FAD/FMN-containing dehydrogenase/Fe-S oxidoreductase
MPNAKWPVGNNSYAASDSTFTFSTPMIFQDFASSFSGEFYFDQTSQHQAQMLVYATDASVYQEKPVAVAIPKTLADLQKLIQLAQTQHLTLIPRAAGTSLAGQVVGAGLVVDMGKYFNQILELNVAERWVRVQPGVVRDELNAYLKPFGLMFGPETSTANRAMIGGMIGNNSCGLHSVVWGTTRDHLMEVKALLSDASEVTFSEISPAIFQEKKQGTSLEASLYSQIETLLSSSDTQQNIRQKFPKKNITRRNTGYALDFLIDTEPLGGTKPFNFCELVAGSEGTLCLVTEARLALLPLPPAHLGVVCVHCRSIDESLRANLVAMKEQPLASELVDKKIMDFTIGHPEYHACRFFIEGDPAAILMVELADETEIGLFQKKENFINTLKNSDLGYAYPFVQGQEMKLVWDLRKGGLGLLRNLPGDTQPVNLIEDCAVDVADLPAYIQDLADMLARHQTEASYYAHAGAGELHVEPMINLKTAEGQALFRTILEETTQLLQKYNGSLSGEHGDGRLRGEFIPAMVGQANYELFQKIKTLFDPKGIFNKGKITDTPPMNAFLRYQADVPPPVVQTVFDFGRQESFLRLAEKCSGSGDCRKTEVTGGTMCPSYMATHAEKDTTRARANMLRHLLTDPAALSLSQNSLTQSTKEVLDLCLSCKGCKSECPSSVDIAKMKAEFTQHYHEAYGVPLRSRLVGHFSQLNRLASIAPKVYNFLFSNELTAGFFKKMVGFAPQRSIPSLAPISFQKWVGEIQKTAQKREDSSQKYAKVSLGKKLRNSRVLLFADEFTNYNDVAVGKAIYRLLTALGYQVVVPEHVESGRTFLSKGMVREAQQVAIRNVQLLSAAIADGSPIVGIEPSAVLTLRDEYLDLVPPTLRHQAEQIAENTYLFEEFFAQELDKKRISREDFTTEKRLIKLHGHCHQKALSSMIPAKKALSCPANYEVQLIPSGCCGMAGSFGYEREHYDISMKIGELVLFPTVRQQPSDVLIAAAGTSCRHQIKDGTGRIALHPAEILWEALR